MDDISDPIATSVRTGILQAAFVIAVILGLFVLIVRDPNLLWCAAAVAGIAVVIVLRRYLRQRFFI